MATQFIFLVPDQPGTLANIAETLGQANVNIDGFAGLTMSGKGIISLTTNNNDKAEEVLSSAGIAFEKDEVLLLNLEDKPGQIAMISRAFAEKGVNLEALYITMSGKQVVKADNMAMAKQVATESGVLFE